jgi:hypothetical protein
MQSIISTGVSPTESLAGVAFPRISIVPLLPKSTTHAIVAWHSAALDMLGMYQSIWILHNNVV